MREYRDFSSLPDIPEACVTVGNFDGFHLGHQKIMETLRDRSGGMPRVAVTFRKVPLETLNPARFKGYLFPTGAKNRFLSCAGIDVFLNLDFPEVRDMEARDFIAAMMKKIGKMHLIIGYNFRFGKGNAGDTAFLRGESERAGFGLTVVEKIIRDRIAVSSSAIRDLIQSGEVHTAGDLLGRPFFIVSPSAPGDGLGRKIGFPTINMEPDGQVIPGNGVYFTQYHFRDRWFPSMTYVGRRPTLHPTGGGLRIETNILGIPDETAAALAEKRKHLLLFVRKTRGEKKLHNLEELRKTLYNDRNIILELAAGYQVPEAVRTQFTEENDYVGENCG